MSERTTIPAAILSPQSDWSGIFVTLGFGIIGNTFVVIIDWFSGPSVIVNSIIILVTAALIYLAIKIRNRTAPLQLIPDTRQPPPHRGLIVLVGTGRPGEDEMSQSAGKAIEYHADKLKYCWLIASGGEKGSVPVAQKLEQICKDKHIEPFIHTIHDPFESVQESYDLITEIYDNELEACGLTSNEVIADFTGGTKPMSVGMVLACGHQRAMQYMVGRKEGIATQPVLIRFTQQR